MCCNRLPYCRILCEYIDGFFRENARRALAKDPPLTRREARDRWNEMMEKRSAYLPRSATRQEPPRHDNGRGRGRKRGGGSNPPRGGTQTRGNGAKFNGDSVCYHYNRAAGCTRTAKGVGCDNGTGGIYAHVCNFESSRGVYCLSKHPKVGNH